MLSTPARTASRPLCTALWCCASLFAWGCTSGPRAQTRSAHPRPSPATTTASGADTASVDPGRTRSVSARALSMHSSGDARGDAWLLSDNGFVGSYLRLDQPARVKLAVRARGHAEAGAPRLELAVAGQTRDFDAGAEVAEHAFDF